MIQNLQWVDNLYEDVWSFPFSDYSMGGITLTDLLTTYPGSVDLNDYFIGIATGVDAIILPDDVIGYALN